MTTPDEPGGTSEPTPPQPADPYGQPPAQPYAQPYGQPPAAQPGYGQPPAAPYGAPPVGYGYGAPAGNYGNWLQRVGAYIVDLLVVLPGYIVAAIGGAIGGGFGAFLIIVGYLIAIGLLIWNRYVRMGSTGQSIGKQVLNLKLIREADGQPMGGGMAFVRDLAHILDSLACYIGWLWPLWDNKRQTFADKVCSSVVVQV